MQSCRPEILYPQLVHDTPHNRNPEKYTEIIGQVGNDSILLFVVSSSETMQPD